jgi:LysR family transcriptional regulator, glycine cleavage system transcriptional activator
MRRHLPPFSAVRAFEAAARHLSFKAAAAELNVTQSAISHQVKGLEVFLGAALFHRTASGVALTRCGRDYFADLSSVLDRLDASTERARGTEISGPVSVRATPAFTSRWLLPRMNGFNTAYPEIELEVTTTTNPMHFPADGVDILIQYGQRPVDGLRVDPFLSSSRFPVCSPDLLKAGPPIRKPEDLARVTLLRDVVGDDWATWFACADSRMPAKIKGPRLAHCELTMTAAEEGQGVALAYGALIDREIADGRLVKLFDLETPPKVIYSLTCPEGWTNRPRIAAFRNWVLAEVAESPATQRH